MLESHFSIYNNIKSTVSDERITLQELVEILRQPNDQVKRIRTLTTSFVSTGDKSLKKTIGNLKAGLPYITPGGTFTVRKDDGLIDYSGVVQIDIDVKDVVVYSVIDELKEAVANLPFVAIAAISPSGCGIKGMALSTNTDPANHAQVVHQVCKLVENAVRPILEPLGIDVSSAVDRCAQALSQPMYITSDKNIYYNPSAIAYDFVPVEGWVNSTSAPKKENKKVAKSSGKVKLSSDGTRELLPGEKEVLTKKPALVDKSISAQHKCLSEYVKFLQSVAGTCEKYHKSFSYGSFYSIKLIGYANSMGVDQDVLYDWMIAAGWTEAEDFARIRDMYSRFADSHGLGFEYKRIVQAIIPEISDDECLWVPDGGYLSDVIDGTKISKNTHIVAPTGSGKTHLPFDGKQIWVFPTTALCQQFFDAHQFAWTVFCDAPSPEGSRDLIITTYDSFVRVAKEVDLSEYTVILDEVHIFVTGSAPGYKLEALRNTLNLLHIPKKVFTLTATPFPNKISVFTEYDTIIAKKKDSFKRNVKLIASEESRRADVVKSVCSRGNFSLIFLQQTDMKVLSQWQNSFAAVGKKVVYINSRKKGTDEFIKLVSDQQVDTDAVYISTSVIAEGVSITTEIPTVDVYIMGNEHPALIEQMSRRFRKIKELNVFLLTGGDSEGSLSIEDLEIASAVRREQLEKLAQGMISAIAESGLALDDANIIGAPVYETDSGELKIDELLIENKIYQNECDLLAGNKKLCMEMLNRNYGYEIIKDVEKMNESAKIWRVDMASEEVVEIAKNVAIGKLYGMRFENPTDDKFIDCLRKHERIVKKIATGLPGITKLGKNALKECFDAFDVWNDKRSDFFITYVRVLNSGCEVRNKFRQLVMKYCVGVPLTSEQRIGYGSILFDHEMMSASDRQKSEFMTAVLLAHDPKITTVRTVKNVPKIIKSGSGDDVEVAGVEKVKRTVKVDMKTFHPVPERIAFEPDLMALNIFGYKSPITNVKVMSTDVQFRQDLLTIPGFAF